MNIRSCAPKSFIRTLGRLTFLALAAPVLGPLCFNWSGCSDNSRAMAQESASAKAATDSSWSMRITSSDEEGEPMVVTGTVYAPDGKTPLPGITVYVYHTDGQGYYRKGSNSSQNPRLKGTMKSNAEGKYEYRTIRPAPYPGGGNPAHVHYVLSGKGYAKQYDALMFEGDRYLSQKQRSTFDPLDTFSDVRPLVRDQNGVWRAVKDVRLKK